MTTVETVRAVVTADASQYNREIGGASGRMSGLAKTAGKAAAAVGVAFTAAAGVIAVKSVTAFAGFETGMNEVKTLLPDLSADMFGKMQDDLLDFGTEFGILTGDSIPALYSAISAGVPADNVMTFMEIAAKAAKGGATDLETAVDGISSVVNAYGSEVIDATEASDLMFTSVRLGKITMEELSANIANVTPIASALGVGFEEVSASLATITSTGKSVATASTELSGVFNELGKDGTTADKAFRKIAGESFSDFIAAGGNVAEAMELMGQQADIQGTAMSNLFGSKEAGASAQILLDNIDGLNSNLDEMSNSTGASQAAFEQMDQGLGASMDKIKAGAEKLMIQIGEKLAPVVAKALDWIVEHMDDFKKAGKDAFEAVKKQIKKLEPAFKSIVGFVEDLVEAFQEDGLSGAVDMVMGKLKPLTDWMNANKPIVAAAAAGIAGALVTAFALWAIGAAQAAAMTLLAIWPIIAVGVAAAALAAGFVWLYQNVDIFRTAIDTMKDAAIVAFNWLKTNVPPIVETIIDLFMIWVDLHVTIAKAVWTMAEKIGEVAAKVIGFYVTIYTAAWDMAKKIGEVVVDIIAWYVNFYTAAWNMAWEIGKVVAGIVGFFIALPGKIKDAVVGVFDSVMNAASSAKDWISDRVDTIIGFFTGMPERIKTTALGMFDGIKESFKSMIRGLVEAWNKIDISFTVPDIPGVPKRGETFDLVPDVTVPFMAKGGIVNGPTMAMIGEAGPEAVIPLSRLGAMTGGRSSSGGGGGKTEITINMPPGSDGDDVVRALQNYARKNGGVVPVTIGQQ